MDATHKIVFKECVLEGDVKVTTVVRQSVLKARRWHEMWKPDQKGVQNKQQTKRCKRKIECYVYLICKYYVTSHNEYKFRLPTDLFYNIFGIVCEEIIK